LPNSAINAYAAGTDAFKAYSKARYTLPVGLVARRGKGTKTSSTNIFYDKTYHKSELAE